MILDVCQVHGNCPRADICDKRTSNTSTESKDWNKDNWTNKDKDFTLK